MIALTVKATASSEIAVLIAFWSKHGDDRAKNKPANHGWSFVRKIGKIKTYFTGMQCKSTVCAKYILNNYLCDLTLYIQYTWRCDLTLFFIS